MRNRVDSLFQPARAPSRRTAKRSSAGRRRTASRRGRGAAAARACRTGTARRASSRQAWPRRHRRRHRRRRPPPRSTCSPPPAAGQAASHESPPEPPPSPPSPPPRPSPRALGLRRWVPAQMRGPPLARHLHCPQPAQAVLWSGSSGRWECARASPCPCSAPQPTGGGHHLLGHSVPRSPPLAACRSRPAAPSPPGLEASRWWWGPTGWWVPPRCSLVRGG